ncbi:MAG: hemagglutinin [Comamonadaceae bacterium]|nr:MAG: hemagglutinin [Comamonadaceae bacterium]
MKGGQGREAAPASHAERHRYEAATAELGVAAARMLASGASEEAVARWMVDQRNHLRRTYRDVTPPDLVRVLEAHSLRRYGNPLGPSADQLRDGGKSWRDIIASAARAGEMPTA